MSLAAVSKLAGSVWADLRERRLWPLALALVVGVIAVPVLLSRSPAPAPQTAPLAALGATSSPPGVAIAALSSTSGPSHGDLHGHGRDPFGGGSGTATTPAAVGAPATTTASQTGSGSGTTTPSSAAGTPSAGSGSSATAVSTPAPSGGAPAPPLPAKRPTPAPSGLTATQSYEVQISMTNASGGLDRFDPTQRLALLPNPQQPLLVELGVLQSGHRVLFAVAPGAVLRGPGSCVPGPIDCEILSLGPDQIESLATDISSSPVAMFAITAITAADHPSTAAAQQARQSVSAAGRQLVSKLSLPALSLFHYDAGVGAVVDLRNLTVGGS
jgi:hypothetical protein